MAFTEDASAIVATAGVRAVFGAAALVGAFAIGAEALDPDGDGAGLLDRFAAPAHTGEATSWSQSSFAHVSTQESDTPLFTPGQFVSARVLSTGFEGVTTTTVAPRARETRRVRVAPNFAAPEPAAPALAPADAPISTAPASESFARLSLDLSTPRASFRQRGASNGSHLAGLETLRPPPTRSTGIEARAAAWVPDWRAPTQRDVSLFVAADDEAVSWSFTDSSPNHGRLAYQADRIEVGEMSAGVSVAVRDMQVSLAYVSREEPSQLGYSAREDYAGVVWTYRR